MEIRTLGNITEEISLLGYGCMRFPKIQEDKPEIDKEKSQKLIDYAYEHGVNYFDTAYPYHGGLSELFIGEALKKYPRESFYLATKMPPWDIKTTEDAERIFEEQLKKCQVSYFDFYLLHNMNTENFKHFEDLKAYELLSRKKAEGKIRYLGFSFHDTPKRLKTFVQAHDWDFAQIQLNYLDWEFQDAKGQYEILADNGIPVIVMEPVRGGALATLCDGAKELLLAKNPKDSVASWAIRYAASLPNVLTVLSGMSDMAQVQDNVATVTNFKPLDEGEREVLDKALELYKESRTVPCTGCSYCMPCPAGVDIPQIFAIYNQYCVSRDKGAFIDSYQELEESKRAHNCVNCKKCMEHCPQSIKIPNMLDEAGTFASTLL